MSNTIRIDIDALRDIKTWVKQVKETLDNQKDLVPSMYDRLDAAIEGTAPQIANFETKFRDWTNLLNIVTTDMGLAYTALDTLYQDAIETSSSFD